MAAATQPTITHISAPTHFPIKLTSTNFLIWKKQIESTLIGLDLVGYINGSTPAPAKFSDQMQTVLNPAYKAWFRQDQTVLSAILGSLSDTLQPVISSATSACDAWARLSTSCAAASRGRIVSLKTKLAKNPKANRSIDSYKRDMRAIADDLALAQSPVTEEDLVVHIFTQLGDEYNSIVAALRVRTEAISYSELHDVLTDYERILQDNEAASTVHMPTANATQRRSYGPADTQSYNSNRRGRGGSVSSNGRQKQVRNNGNRTARYCNYCDYPGHDTKFCRKLAKFLKENNVTVLEPQNTGRQSPTIHSTSTTAQPTQPWLMDSGASHHTANDAMALHTLADYTGPDEIILGDGNSLRISHTGSVSLPSNSRSISLSDVLCVPSFQNNLISVSKLCKTNSVSDEFFDTHFAVKDRQLGAPLVQGPVVNDVYSLPVQQSQINVTTMSSLSKWHHQFGHPNSKVLACILRHNNVSFKPEQLKEFSCNSCHINKSHKLPFSFSTMSSTRPLQLIYTDVWSSATVSVDGFKYYINFVDHYT
ncbi:PREDICTED: uncharacterized protein LOC109158431 [Ipomoea nil]|uniref:uncharacterized protein LOC109158431 n=1 Tax=Ipomoea nil TaxID=35883 RepID=UPI0009019A0B|nr:PREDICTED: uncharacterized protein LOC109158431 [Ipomoea nil]